MSSCARPCSAAVRTIGVVALLISGPCTALQPVPAAESSTHAAQLQSTIDRSVLNERWADALAPARELVGLRQATVAAQPAASASALLQLAALERRAGLLKAAAASYARAVTVLESAFGVLDTTLVDPLSDLGLVYAELDAVEPATQALERAVQIVRRSLGVFDPRQAQLLEELAALDMRAGSVASATDNVKYLLRLYATIYGERDPRVAEPLSALAYGYAQRGSYEEARDLYSQQIRWIEATGGPHHPALAGPLRGLADTEMRAFRVGDPERIRRDPTMEPRHTGSRFLPQDYVDPQPGVRSNLTAGGEASLLRAVALMEARPETTTVADFVATLLQAGDFQLARGDTARAELTYLRVWRIAHDEDPHWNMRDAEPGGTRPLVDPVPIFLPPVVVRGAY